MKKTKYLYGCLLAFIYSCANTPHDITKTSDTLEIYPEYDNISIPCNIAPLNFLVRNDGVEAVQAEVEGISLLNEGNKVQWDQAAWKQLIS